MSPCDKYEALISTQLDDALTPEEEEQLESHLAQCPRCRALADELADLHDYMTEMPRLEPPADLTRQITAAVAADKLRPLNRWGRQLRRLGALAALLAVVLVGAGMSGLFHPQQPAALDTPMPLMLDEPELEPEPDSKLRTTDSVPAEQVLIFCAGQLFPGTPYAFDPDTSILTLTPAKGSPLELTCVRMDPRGRSIIALTADGKTTRYQVELSTGVITPQQTDS